MWRPEIWKTHKRRDDFTECPHCGKPLQWIYDGNAWMPCDKEPVMFIMHPEGKQTIVYNRKVYENCLLYRKGDRRFDGVHPLMGSMQHYFTCEVLKQHRRDYMRGKGG